MKFKMHVIGNNNSSINKASHFVTNLIQRWTYGIGSSSDTSFEFVFITTLSLTSKKSFLYFDLGVQNPLPSFIDDADSIYMSTRLIFAYLVGVFWLSKMVAVSTEIDKASVRLF